MTKGTKQSGDGIIYNQEIKIQEQEDVLIKAIQYLSLALLVTPLLVSNLFFFPYMVTKTIFVYPVMEIIFGVYLVLCLKNKKYWPKLFFRKKTHGSKTNWILALSGLFLFIVTITNFFSVNPVLSFWGNINWTNGLVTLIHVFVWMVVLSSMDLKKDYWVNFFRMNLIVGTLVAIYAMIQAAGGKMANSTIGNTSYVAGYLIFVLFESLAMFWYDKKASSRFAYFVPAAASLITILFCLHIRGGQLGLLVSPILPIFFFLLASPKKSFQQVAKIGAVVFLVGALLGSIYLVESGKLYAVFNSKRAGTIKTRLITWKIAWQSALKRPLVGYGSETFYYPFERNFNPQYYSDQNDTGQAYEFGGGLAHNKLLEVFNSNGIFALASYLSIFLALLILLYKKYRYQHQPAVLAFVGLVSAYFVHNLFIFDTIAIYMAFFSLMAFLSSYVYSIDEEPVKVSNDRTKLGASVFYSATAAIFIGVIISAYYCAVVPAKAAYYTENVIYATSQKKYSQALVALDQAWAQAPDYMKEKISFKVAVTTEGVLAGQKNLSDDQKKLLLKNIELMEQTLQKEPYRFYDYISLGNLYNLAAGFDRRYLEKNIALCQRAMKLGSKRVESFYLLAITYAKLGEQEKSLAAIDQAIALNSEYGQSYLTAAITSAQFEGQENKTLGYLQAAIDHGNQQEMVWRNYVDLANKQSQWDKAIIGTQELIRRHPNEPQLRVNLMVFYLNSHQAEQAKQTAAQIIQMYPNLKGQVDEFLKKELK